ncbi:MAG: transglutaminase-like domain-containing protein [Candidatus Heimdallarchaeota archaeon]
MSTPSRYFGTTIPLAVISTFFIGFIGLSLYSHAASYSGQVEEALRQGGLVVFSLTFISTITLRIIRKKTALRTIFATIIEGAKGAILYVVGDQFFAITSSTTLEWTNIAAIIPILTIISLYLPSKKLETLASKRWGRRLITATPALLFILLMLSGYLVELGQTRHRELEPAKEDIETRYFEAGFKVSFWKGIQLEAPDDVVFMVDPIPQTDLQRLWRLQVWDRYTTREWLKTFHETENLNAWRDPIPIEQDEFVDLGDPSTYQITIPILLDESSALMYQDYLPTGWWDAKTYGTYIRPDSIDVVTDIPYEAISYTVESDYSTYRGGIRFQEEGSSNLTYRIDYYPFDYIWPTKADVSDLEDINAQEWEGILPRVETYIKLPIANGSQYPNPVQHPYTERNASALKRTADEHLPTPFNIFERAIFINDYLAHNYEFDNESFFGTELAETQPENKDMVEWFLERGKGTHVHFASAMAVFLRYQGIPCRVVRGYAEGDDEKGKTLVRQKHIIVWVEVFIPYMLNTGTLVGRWHPFFPILPLGAAPTDYRMFVWPGIGPPPIRGIDSRGFIVYTNQPFQLNAMILNNATAPPIPVPEVQVTFLNLDTFETLGEVVTSEEGIASIEYVFTPEDSHGFQPLGARIRGGAPTPSTPIVIHQKYDVRWLVKPPPIVVQGKTYPISAQPFRTVDNSVIGAGVNITFSDNLFLPGAVLYETPIKYWAITNEEGIASIDFSIPTDIDFPLGNHTVEATFTTGEDYVTSYSTPFFVAGGVVINPTLAASLTRTPVFNIIPFKQELLDRQVETPFPQKILGFFRKQAHSILCLTSFASKVKHP